MKLLFQGAPVTSMDDWSFNRLRLRLERGHSVKLVSDETICRLREVYQAKGLETRQVRKVLFKNQKPIRLTVFWVPSFGETEGRSEVPRLGVSGKPTTPSVATSSLPN